MVRIKNKQKIKKKNSQGERTQESPQLQAGMRQDFLIQTEIKYLRAGNVQ